MAGTKKLFKEIEMPLNCGLEALSKIADLKNVSAFTLIHLGRDNGLNLHVFKVNDLADLIRVVRPAIFHQKDHFVYIKNGEPMPKGEYTGFVIGSNVMGRVISLAEAKIINGSKNFFTGQNKDGEQTGSGALKLIVTAVAATVGFAFGGPPGAALAGAGANTLYGGIERAQNPAQLGSPYDPLKLGIDALSGGAEGLGIGGGISGASNAAPGITSRISGFGQGAFNALSHPISTLANGSVPGGTLAAQTAAAGGGVSNAFNAAGGAAANAAKISGIAGGGDIAASLGSAVGNAVGSGVGSGATFNPIYSSTATNFSSNPSFSLSGLNLPSSGGSGISSLASGANSTSSTASNTFDKLVNPSTIIGGAGLLLSKPPQVQGTAIDNYSAVQQFLGPNALKAPTSNQLLQYINTPISDLQTQFSADNSRTLNTINQAYDNQRQQLVHQFAQAGQNLSNSSELQDKVNQLEQKRTNDLTLAQQELHNQALGQAVQVKQQALSNALQQGQYDANIALDLAKLTGDDQALQYAIANNDYQTFQSIMGKILTSGLPTSLNSSNK